MEKSMEVPLKTKTIVTWSSDPTPGHIPQNTIIQKDTDTPVFIVTLFTIAKTWKQPKSPSTNEWIKIWGVCVCVCVCVCVWILLSHKKEWNNAIWSNISDPRDYHTEWRKQVRERKISYDITYMWNLKKLYRWTYVQNRNRPTGLENKLMITKKERRGER